MKRHLFAISPGVRAAVGPEDCAATVAALRKLDLYRLPYDTGVWVQFLADDIVAWFDPKTGERKPGSMFPVGPTVTVEIGPLTTDPKGYFLCRMMLRDAMSGFSEDISSQDPRWVNACENATAFLITLLATRNAVKSTKEHKLAKLGIGKKQRFDYTTSISLPRAEDMEDDEDHAPTGVARCPHLRRGHIRNQHYGPRNSFVKRVWIEPVFVNADPSFVSTRKAYNIAA